MHYSFPPEVQLARKSLEYFENWPAVVGRPGDFRRTGFVRIVPEGERDRLEANVAMQSALGVDTRVVSRDEMVDQVSGSGEFARPFPPNYSCRRHGSHRSLMAEQISLREFNR